MEIELDSLNMEMCTDMEGFAEDYYYFYLNMLRRFTDGRPKGEELGDEFFREFGHPYRRISDSVFRLIKQVFHFNFRKKKHAYVTVFSYDRFISQEEAKFKYHKEYNRKIVPDYPTANINKIYFDLDLDHKVDGTLEDAWEDAKKLMQIDTNARVIYTANRGFNVYIHDTAENSEELAEKQAKIIFEDEERTEKRIETADLGFLGDIARIMRIPFTVHIGTGRLAVPVVRGDTLDRVVERSKRVPNPMDMKLIKYW